MQHERSHPPMLTGGEVTSLVGETVGGRYRIEERLASGGMCDIYRARQVSMDRWVALKVMRSTGGRDAPYAQWFYREMRAAARIQHPNTVRVYDFGQLQEGPFWLTMELLEGRSLESEIATGGRFALVRAVHVAMQVAKALNAAHEEGVVHRDLKGDNILLLDLYGERDFVKVVDFGLAAMPGPTGARGLVAGTPEFMAPEQALGHDVDARADLYGLGILLYHMTTGRLPFRSSDAREVLQMQVHRNPAPPSTLLRGGLPIPLEELILDLLHKEPGDRPPTARAVLERLGACASHPLVSRRTHTRWEDSSPALVVRPFDEAAALRTPAPSDSVEALAYRRAEPGPGRVREPGAREPGDREDDVQLHEEAAEQAGPTLAYRPRRSSRLALLALAPPSLRAPVRVRSLHPARPRGRWMALGVSSFVVCAALLLQALPDGPAPLARPGALASAAGPQVAGARLLPPSPAALFPAPLGAPRAAEHEQPPEAARCPIEQERPAGDATEASEPEATGTAPPQSLAGPAAPAAIPSQSPAGPAAPAATPDPAPSQSPAALPAALPVARPAEVRAPERKAAPAPRAHRAPPPDTRRAAVHQPPSGAERPAPRGDVRPAPRFERWLPKKAGGGAGGT